MPSALIMHIDMDAFFAAVEQQVNPGLRGKPVIVGGRPNRQRSIIVAASYEAKAYGIKSGMPSWRAFALCPRAVFVPADTAKYVYTSEHISEILKDFAPRVEQFSIDEFFLDIGGGGFSGESACQIGREIKARIKKQFGLTCTVGIAPTRIVAKLAAKLVKPDGLFFLDKPRALRLLEDMPLDTLCGVGRRLRERFRYLGIETCG